MYGANGVPANGHDYKYWNREDEVPPSVLVGGANVIAVELYNGNALQSSASSDLYFDAEMDVFVGVKSSATTMPKLVVGTTKATCTLAELSCLFCFLRCS